MKTPWLIAVRPTPAVLEKHGKPPNTIETYAPWRWCTSATRGDGPEYLIMEMDDGPSVRWPFALIDSVTITRVTEIDQ